MALVYAAYVNSLPGIMTANNAPSPYVASASTEYLSNYAYKAFDKTALYWSSSAMPAWLSIDLGSSIYINTYTLTAYSSLNNIPTAWLFQGSSDNNTWITLDSQSGINFAASEMRIFSIDYPGSYRYYRLYITGNVGGVAYSQVAQLDLYNIGTTDYGMLNTNQTTATLDATSNTAPSPQVISSNDIESVSYPMWRAFAQDLTVWVAGTTSKSFYTIMVDLGSGYEKAINKYAWVQPSGYSNKQSYCPKDFVFQGTNNVACTASDAKNDNDWQDLDVRTNCTTAMFGTDISIYYYFACTNRVKYRFYRFYITDTIGGKDTYRPATSEIKLVEQYDNYDVEESVFISGAFDGASNTSTEFSTLDPISNNDPYFITSTDAEVAIDPAYFVNLHKFFQHDLGYSDIIQRDPPAPLNLMIDLRSASRLINKYQFYYLEDISNYSPPASFQFQGSNDENAYVDDAENANGWVTLDTVIDSFPDLYENIQYAFGVSALRMTRTFSTTTKYRKYRFRITETVDGYYMYGATVHQIRLIEDDRAKYSTYDSVNASLVYAMPVVNETPASIDTVEVHNSFETVDITESISPDDSNISNIVEITLKNISIAAYTEDTVEVFIDGYFWDVVDYNTPYDTVEVSVAAAVQTIECTADFSSASTDAIDSSIKSFHTVTESFSLGDSVPMQLTFERSISETTSSTDSVSISVSIITVSVDESPATTDSVNVTYTQVALVSESSTTTTTTTVDSDIILTAAESSISLDILGVYVEGEPDDVTEAHASVDSVDSYQSHVTIDIEETVTQDLSIELAEATMLDITEISEAVDSVITNFADFVDAEDSIIVSEDTVTVTVIGRYELDVEDTVKLLPVLSFGCTISVFDSLDFVDTTEDRTTYLVVLDNLTIQPLLTIVGVFSLNVEDTIIETDSVLTDFFFTTNESLSIADTITEDLYLLISELLDMADMQLSTLLGSVSISDSIYIDEELIKLLCLSIQEALDASDISTTGLQILISELLQLVEVHTINWRGTKTLQDNIDTYDNIIATFCIAISDAIAASDNAGLVIQILTNEFISIIDEHILNIASSHSVHDTIYIFDKLLEYFNLIITESLTSTETLSSIKSLEIIIAELLLLNESNIINWIGTLTISEQLFVLDYISRHLLVLLSDVLAASDSSSITLFLLISETLQALENNYQSWHSSHSLSEGLSIVDFAPLIVFDKVVAEILQSVDSSSITLLISVLENLNLLTTNTSTGNFLQQALDILHYQDNTSIGLSLLLSENLSSIDTAALSRLLICNTAEMLNFDVSLLNVVFAAVGIIDMLGTSETLVSTGVLYTIVYDTVKMFLSVEFSGDVYECYVLNTTKFLPSVYTGFNFNSYCVFENIAYGCKTDGLYSLGGSVDSGVPFQTGVELSETSFGITNKKRFIKAFIGLDSTGDTTMMMQTDDGDQKIYTVESSGEVDTSRAYKGKRWKMSVVDFDTLEFIKLYPVILVK